MIYISLSGSLSLLPSNYRKKSFPFVDSSEYFYIHDFPEIYECRKSALSKLHKQRALL